eukprot:521939_1
MGTTFSEERSCATCNPFSSFDDDENKELVVTNLYKASNEAHSKPTKRAIATAHLLSRIIYEFFQNPQNSCDIGTIDIHAILDNILILGGAPRDYLLQRDINDIDIHVNIRELTKIQKLHLKKYHSNVHIDEVNDSKCILWRLYLNKIEANQQESEETDDIKSLKKKWETDPTAEYLYFSNLSYILNAKFFMAIITDSEYFRNKLDMKISDTFKVYQFIINKQLMYNGVNLEGQDCDFLNICRRDRVLLDPLKEIHDGKLMEIRKLFQKKYNEQTLNTKLMSIRAPSKLKLLYSQSVLSGIV